MPVIEGLKRMIDKQLEQGKKEEELKKKEVEALFTERARVHITVLGKVQGVFFRQFVKQTADSLGLTGWAKNTDGGNVEIVAEGDKSRLRELIVQCKKGSALAQVDKIDYEWEEFTGKFNDFYINY